MAVIGHAQVIVRAITDKVQGDIEKAFKGSSNVAGRAGRNMGSALTRGIGKSLTEGAGNAFQNLAKNIEKLYPEAEGARRQFISLNRAGNTLTPILGAVAGSLGAVVGALGALVGAAGAGAVSLVAVAGAAISAGVGMKIATYALGGISQAVQAATRATGGYRKSLQELAFEQEEAALTVARAELNLEKARESAARTADLAPNNRIRREAELAVQEAEAALRRAKAAESGDSAGGGGTDPFAGLTPSQRKFAEFLVGIQGTFDKLKEAAAKGFLPLLQTQIEKLITAGFFEVLEVKFERLATGAGKAVENFTDIFLAGDNLSDFYKILDNIADILPQFGTILGNAFGGFLSIMEAADPLTRRFVDFLEKKSGQLATFLDTKQASGELEDFFNKAGDIGAKFGEIFGNIFAGFGSLIRSNFGPGSGGYALLEWLDKATEGWRNLDLISQQKYFKGAADNFIAMGDAIGGAIDTIIQRGSDPAIKDFWDTLDRGSFAFDQIVRQSVASAPALAEFLKAMTDLVAIFTDSEQPKAFFGTLTAAVRVAVAALKPLKPLLDIVGVVLGVTSALGLLAGVFMLLKLTIMGTFKFLALSVAPIVGAFIGRLLLMVGATNAATVAMTLFNTTNPVGWITLAVTAIAALVAGLMAIQGANTEKAVGGITQSFKDNASASDVWKEASLANWDGWAKDSAASMTDFKKNLNSLDQAGGAYANGANSVNIQVRQAFKTSLDAVGKSLANLATTELPNAQGQFKKFTDETRLSREEQIKALDNMGDYTQALKDQAEQMGIELEGMDGLIDKQKLLDFARGEGEIAVRKAEAALADFNTQVMDSAVQMAYQNTSLEQNEADTKAWAEATAQASRDTGDSWQDYYDGVGFSSEKYIDDLQKQLQASLTYADDMARLADEAGTELAAYLKSLGDDVAKALLPDLLDPVKGPALRRELAEAARLAGVEVGTGYVGGINSSQSGVRFARPGMPGGPIKDGGYIGFASGGFVSGLGTARSDSIPAMISNGEYVVNARATANNRKLLDAINSNSNIPNAAPNINVTINASPGMDERELANMVSRKIAFEVRKGAF
jgi:hypothetical protein